MFSFDLLSRETWWVGLRTARVIALRTLLLVVLLFLAFYNLADAPRSWHDEGASLSLAKTLVENGVYAVRTSDGYQTFGPVQSVGPTVLLPIAISFKLFGVGLLQGRAVIAIYFLLTVIVFYRWGLTLFSSRVALLAVVLLLCMPGVGFLRFSRQALGEIPAFGFLIASWLAWTHYLRARKQRLVLLAGLLLGAAMITKMQYLLMGVGSLVLLGLLDWQVYRQGAIKSIIVMALTAVMCVAAWWVGQIAYFGIDVFRENAIKLRDLSTSTTGFNLRTSLQNIRLLVGADSDHFYYFWGFPALIYASVLSARRNREGLALALPLIFTALSLAYWLFWFVSWQLYALAPMAITALFVAKLWSDTLTWGVSWARRQTEPHAGWPAQAVTSLMVAATFAIMVVYAGQTTIRADILQTDRTPQQAATFLDKAAPPDAVIETWERELSILTNHSYHFPDQSMLIKAHAAAYHNGMRDYALGADYFQKYHPSYIVIGWFARWTAIYDEGYVKQHGRLLATIGDGESRYEIYELLARQ